MEDGLFLGVVEAYLTPTDADDGDDHDTGADSYIYGAPLPVSICFCYRERGVGGVKKKRINPRASHLPPKTVHTQ